MAINYVSEGSCVTRGERCFTDQKRHVIKLYKPGLPSNNCWIIGIKGALVIYSYCTKSNIWDIKKPFLTQNHSTLFPYDKITIFYQTFEKSISKQIFDSLGYLFWQSSLFSVQISPLFFDCFPKCWWPAPKKCNCDFEFAFLSNHHWYIVCQITNNSIFYMIDFINSRFWEFGMKM